MARRTAEDSLSKFRNEYQTNLNNLNNELVHINSKLGTANDCLLEETKKNKDFSRERVELKQEKENLGSQLQNLQKLNEKAKLELKEANSRIVGLEKDYERVENDKNSLTSIHSILVTNYDNLSEAFENSNSRIASINNLFEQASEM